MKQDIHSSFLELKRYYHSIKGNDLLFNQEFAFLLRRSEALLVNAIWCFSDLVDDIQVHIDEICSSYETVNPDRKKGVRFAFTTTDAPNAIKTLVSSILTEIEKSSWNSRCVESNVAFLIVENSSSLDIRKSNKLVCEEYNDRGVNVHYVSMSDKVSSPEECIPYSISKSRAYLITRLAKCNWQASFDYPIWILDDDFEFISMIPNLDTQIQSKRVGSIFHRLECVAKEASADAIVGGNAGSPPIPELSTIRLQLCDLIYNIKNTDVAVDMRSTFEQIMDVSEYYYDLSRTAHDYFPVPLVAHDLSIQSLGVFFSNLLKGIPTTRHLYSFHYSNITEDTVWSCSNNLPVSGGNTIYFNNDLLDVKNYWALEFDGGVSRRADAIWRLISEKDDYEIVTMNFALNHKRQVRIEPTKESLMKNAVRDILGVALWEYLRDNKNVDLLRSDCSFLSEIVSKRVNVYNDNTTSIRDVLEEIECLCPEVRSLLPFQILCSIAEEKINVSLENVKLIRE